MESRYCNTGRIPSNYFLRFSPRQIKDFLYLFLSLFLSRRDVKGEEIIWFWVIYCQTSRRPRDTLVNFHNLCYNVSNMAIKVTRKDQSEANENIIRRFNRKVLQSGIMPLKKSQMRFSKPISKRERRMKAIIREARKAEKTERIKLGLK